MTKSLDWFKLLIAWQSEIVFLGGHVGKQHRGFASMDARVQSEIASMGGVAAHEKGTAHEWTRKEARRAGRKGGLSRSRRKKGKKKVPPLRRRIFCKFVIRSRRAKFGRIQIRDVRVKISLTKLPRKTRKWLGLNY